MEDVSEALAAEHAALAEMVDPLDEAGWAAQSRCAGWSVSDVVLHLAQTDELAVASLRGTFDDELEVLAGGLGSAGDVEDGAGLLVARERGAPGAAVGRRWAAAAAALRDELAVTDPSTRVTWVVGDLAARTLATTRLTETWIHAGDVAAGLGVEPAPTDRLWHIARLAWRTLPHAFARAGRPAPGPVAFELTAPSGDVWTFAPGKSPHAGSDAPTRLTGDAVELCLVAGQRLDAAATGLRAEGPDGDAVLELVRTFA
jgi:uncharacterized protein (TIGR03084 family)